MGDPSYIADGQTCLGLCIAGPAKDLVMGLSAHDQTFALRVDLKEITELSGVKKQAGAELYPKLSKKFKKVRKKCEKHQIFRKLAADSSADASADEVGRINISKFSPKRLS